MKPAPAASVVISTQGGSAALSSRQKTFNRLIKKIAGLREALQAWQDAVPIYRHKRETDLMPLLRSYDQQRMNLLKLLDQADARFRLTKAERAKVTGLIGSLATELLSVETEPDIRAELTAIYDRHHDTSFAQQQEEAAASMQSMMEQMLGIDLGDEVDLDTPEKALAALHEKLRERHQQEHPQDHPQEVHPDWSEAASASPGPGPRQASAQARAKQAKLEKEAEGISLSIREVYRKLASALHPDREPDHTERERKTALMQRVNLAYGKKDLLQLLELQLEVEQLDQTALDTISDDRLKHYNKVLLEQAAELEMEVQGFESSFDFSGGFRTRRRIEPKFVLRALDADIAAMRQDVQGLQRDLQQLRDIKTMKAWLRYYRAPRDDDFDLFANF